MWQVKAGIKDHKSNAGGRVKSTRAELNLASRSLRSVQKAAKHMQKHDLGRIKQLCRCCEDDDDDDCGGDSEEEDG